MMIQKLEPRAAALKSPWTCGPKKKAKLITAMCICSKHALMNQIMSVVLQNNQPIAVVVKDNAIDAGRLRIDSRAHFYVMYPTPAESYFFLTKRGFVMAIVCEIAATFL